MRSFTKNLLTILPILFFALIILLYFTEISYAGPLAPSPVCVIDASVLNIQKAKAQFGGRGPNYPYTDYYAVKLRIHNSSRFQPDKEKSVVGSCDELIKKTEQDTVLPLSEYDKFPIETGQEINANVQQRGDEWFHGYYLSNIKILKTTTLPSIKPVLPTPQLEKITKIKASTEISTILINQKLVTTVESIELKNQSYNISGVRTTKIFGLIPVELKLRIIANAKTGNMESITSPWWAFLTR